MSLWRWLLTIVGYPLGGLLAITFFSTSDGPLAAGGAGLLAGSVLGAAQWLALRPRARWWWIAVTAGGLGGGAAVAAVVVGTSTAIGSLIAVGAIAGLVLGLAQAAALGVAVWRGALWALTVSATWALAWLISATVIVDESRGFVTFGLSGAAVVTVVGGLVLRMILGPRPTRDERAALASEVSA